MGTIKKLLKTNTPFSIMQYFVSFKGSKRETHKKYELICINEMGYNNYTILNEDDLSYMRENMDKFELVVDNEYGRVYEFNKFKEYRDGIVKNQKPKQHGV